MTLNVTQGVHIYVDSLNRSTLIVYKKLLTKYLTVIFRRYTMTILMADFDHLLDIVPIFSIKLHAFLPIMDDLLETLEAWKIGILNALIMYEETSQMPKRASTITHTVLPPMPQLPRL